MKQMLTDIKIFEELLKRYPELQVCADEIWSAYEALVDTHKKNGTLLVAGNGGSAADSDHIVGELMKSFRIQRSIAPKYGSVFKELFGEDGAKLYEGLEGAIPAISLPSISGLFTAYSNDRDPKMVFAQMVYGYGRENDAFLGISTSGNSLNIILAFMVAKAKKLKTIALTGRTGGRCSEYADIVIRVPSDETFSIQELHLPIYHALCAMEEAYFFQAKCVE